MAQSRERRYAVDMPVLLADGSGVARNISTSGIYLETELSLHAGAPLSFTVNFDDTPGGRMRMHCDAEIVRIEQKDGRVGVGARIINLKCERIDGSI